MTGAMADAAHPTGAGQPSASVRVFAAWAEAAGEHQVTIEFDGERHGPFAFEFDLGDRVTRVLAGIAEHGGALDDLRDIGTLLWEAVFPGALGDRLRRAIPERHGTLLLELRLDEDLQELPWEMLYDQRTREFLACHPRVCLINRIAPADDRRSVIEVVDKAAMLVVIPEGSGLNVEKELNSIRRATESLSEMLTITELRGRVTVDRLSEQLRTRAWDVVHFVGHGQVVEGQVEIRINGDDGLERWLSADVFAANFTGAQIGLCVLNCCYGASATSVDSMDRLAPGLIAKGVRFVVAMRYAVADQDALRFANKFYHSLLRGDTRGRPDLATQLARDNLRLNASRDLIRSFVTPVFFAGDDNPLLFELRTELTAAPTRSVAAHVKAELVPKELRRAIADGDCVPVLGARLARDASMRDASPAGPRLLLERLMNQLSHATDGPPAGLSELAASNEPPFAALAQAAEHLMARESFQAVVECIEPFCKQLQPHAVHHALAAWNAPGVFYTHIDGLMEKAFASVQRASVIEGVGHELDTSSRPLILVRGTVNNPRSLVIAEHQHDELEDRIHRLPPSIVALVRSHWRRRVVLMGVHPRDRVARLLARRLIDPDERAPKSYLVADDASLVDEAYWARYRVEIVRATAEEFMAALALGGPS